MQHPLCQETLPRSQHLPTGICLLSSRIPALGFATWCTCSWGNITEGQGWEQRVTNTFVSGLWVLITGSWHGEASSSPWPNGFLLRPCQFLFPHATRHFLLLYIHAGGCKARGLGHFHPAGSLYTRPQVHPKMQVPNPAAVLNPLHLSHLLQCCPPSSCQKAAGTVADEVSHGPNRTLEPASATHSLNAQKRCL